MEHLTWSYLYPTAVWIQIDKLNAANQGMEISYVLATLAATISLSMVTVS